MFQRKEMFILGTNKTLADSDGDSIADGAEDFDGDGCSNLKELGTDEKFGGRRNPFNPWDFFDTNGDKIILIDFDKAGQGPILYDLASFCYCFEFPKSIWSLPLPAADINKYQHNFLNRNYFI